MKASRYNYFFEEDGLALGYNTLTNALVKLDEKEKKRFKALIDGTLSPDALADEAGWLRGGFIHEDDADELDRIRTRMLESRFANNALGLTIAPTLSCNFRCVYCYEKTAELEKSMPREVQDRIVGVVAAQANHLEWLSISWYGGEPLLAMEPIRSLTERFRAICGENKIEYSASLITNGYLLSAAIARELASLGVTFVQVTLDGPQEIHDARRPLAGGKGTYETIRKNIQETAEIVPLSLRVNLDRNNQERNNELLDEIEKLGVKDKIYVYPGWVENSNNCYDCSSCLSLPEFASDRLVMAKELVKRGFAMGVRAEYPNMVASTCGADRASSLVIAPDGDLYACWGDIGIKQYRIGSLVNAEGISPARRNAYILYDPTQDPECGDCRYLPICMGGCPKRRIEKNAERCTYFKYGLERYLSFTAERIFEERKRMAQTKEEDEEAGRERGCDSREKTYHQEAIASERE